jgi:sterol desaturase/sphingolipid hydroxylase (fatty acid hydroxylase superfamily)
MHPNLIALSVPVFFAAILAEAFFDARRRRGPHAEGVQRLYRFGTAIADLDVGITSRVFEALLQGIGAFAYVAVFRHRLVSYEVGSPWPWVISLVGIDFLYYWWHRLSHVVNVFWAVHAVHHQSEDFNFAVALRQPALAPLTIIPFHLPLALAGVEPWIYGSSYAVNLLYQFWIHTELPRRLGFLEWVLNTPSAHRVHHGIDAEYLDKNYGGILIVWDRLFGTYQSEERAPVYGVTHPLRSHNPLWANLAPFSAIARLVRAETTFTGKVRALFAHPAGRPARFVAGARVSRESFAKYAPPYSRTIVGYVTAHFVVLALAAGAFMSLAERASISTLALPGLLVLTSAAALGAWTERQRWALPFDIGRQAAVLAWVAWFVGSRFGAVPGALTFGALALVFAMIFAVTPPWRALVTA